MNKIITTDNYNYHLRINKHKIKIIDNFISSKNDIDSILDIGCNSGVLSYKYKDNYDVTGMDLSTKEELKIPDDYNFLQCDISKIKFSEKKYDIIYFLSVYHHLLGKYGIKHADKIFYRILLQSKYLLFDVGNISEIQRSEHTWFTKQKEIFKNEKELLDHFGLPYKLLGQWNVAGGVRSIVLFESKHFEKNIKILKKYKRLIGSEYRDKGLIEEVDFVKYKTKNNTAIIQGNIYEKRLFYKLNIGSLDFFAKEINDTNSNEYNNTINIYKNNNHNNLAFFFGTYNKNFLLFEWIDNLKFIKIVKNTPYNTQNNLVEIQLFESNGKKYYIDFER